MPSSHRRDVEAILAGARAERAALFEQLSPELRASLPVDATGITQAIDHLGEVLGTGDMHRAQQREHRTNPAVLHLRVFGFEQLSGDTVLAAFVDGARVRAGLLGELAESAGGAPLEAEVRGLLERHPPLPDPADPEAEAALRATYAAQEEAAVRIAAYLDG